MSTAAVISPWPLVRLGDLELPVRTLRWLLRAAGSRVSVDGAFGARTEAAARAFQRRNGLAVDAIVGPLTWSALARHGEARQPGRRGGRRAGGVPVPQLVG